MHAALTLLSTNDDMNASIQSEEAVMQSQSKYLSCDFPAFCLGRLVLVVGPSGTGKDTLIARAARELAFNPRFLFVKRMITRPNDFGTEQHQYVSEQEFAAAERTGHYLLSWRAHGFGYAIPSAVNADLSRGAIVVANVSRTVIKAARTRVARSDVIHVTASTAVLKARLSARGRESGADIASWLARDALVSWLEVPVVTIVNDTSIEAASQLFTRALISLTERQALATDE